MFLIFDEKEEEQSSCFKESFKFYTDQHLKESVHLIYSCLEKAASSSSYERRKKKKLSSTTQIVEWILSDPKNQNFCVEIGISLMNEYEYRFFPTEDTSSPSPSSSAIHHFEKFRILKEEKEGCLPSSDDLRIRMKMLCALTCSKINLECFYDVDAYTKEVDRNMVLYHFDLFSDTRKWTRREIPFWFSVDTIVRWKFERYLVLIKGKMFELLEKYFRETSKVASYDIIMSRVTSDSRTVALEEKHILMALGEAWQFAFGAYEFFENVGCSHHYSGLDLISKKRKIAIELKNRSNTDNSSSKKTNYEKLAAFKSENPEYKCIYGFVNLSTENGTKNGTHQKKQVKGSEIEIMGGMKLFEEIFKKEHVARIIEVLGSCYENWRLHER